MKKIIKRTAAAAMSLAIMGGVMPFEAGTFDLSKISLTAEAASGSVSYNSSTGVMTLSGDLTNKKSDITKYNAKSVVAASGTVMPSDCAGLFKSCSNLETVDLSNASFSSTTDMSEMFRACYTMTSVILPSTSSTQSVTNMSNMFSSCSALKTITNLDILNTSNVTNMANMFYSCSALTSLYLSGFDTSKVTDMSFMFYGCSNLGYLDVTSFNTSKTGSMKGMFTGCTSLIELDLSSFDTSKTNGTDLVEWGTYGGVTQWFNECSSLEKLTLGEKVVGSYIYLDNGAESDFPGWADASDPTAVSVTGTGEKTDFKNTKLTTYYKRSAYMEKGSCYSLNSFLGTMVLSGKVDKATVNSKLSGIETITAEDGTVFPADCSDMFSGSAIVTADLDNVDTSNVTNMNQMFNNCKQLESIKLENWDVSNVTSMVRMFLHCESLKEFEAPLWKTENVTNMNSLFSYCKSLEYCYVYGWNTDKVTNLTSMFRKCSSLTYIQLGGHGYVNDEYDYAWRTDNVTDLSSMFSDCTALQHLYILGFTLNPDKTVTTTDMLVNTDLYSLYFSRDFSVSEDMKLRNTELWTSNRANGQVVGGTGEYAVIPANNMHTQYIYRKGYTAIDLTKTNVGSFFTDDRPYPGNAADAYTSYYVEQGYKVDFDNSGWFDAENDCFLSKTDFLQPGGAYIYRVRLVPSAARYFEQPTKAMVDAIKFADYKDTSMEYLDCVAAHLNDDGTLDLYAELANSVNSYDTTQPMALSVLYTLPEGSVQGTGDLFTQSGKIFAHRLLPFANSYTVTTDSIQLKTSLLNYEKVFSNCSYELSIDGKNYVTMESMSGKAFTGLTPGKEYTIYLRAAGETKPFYSEKVATEAAETVMGDANGDGNVNVADVVALQNWLLGKTNATISSDLTAVDLCSDGSLNIFDLVSMRRLVIEKGTE